MNYFFLFVLNLLILLSNSAFANLADQNTSIKLPRYQENKEMLKILALGDSYTVGEGVRYSESFPSQLVDLLRSRNIKVGNPKIIAATGWTTKELLKRISESTPDKDYDLVTLLIGVNDQFQGFDESTYSSGFQTLLEKAIEFAGGRPGRVIVLSIPDYGVTPFGKGFDPLKIRTEINRFNKINKSHSEKALVNYLDVTEISRVASTDSTLLVSDGLHPSPKMYSKWSELIANIIINVSL